MNKQIHFNVTDKELYYIKNNAKFCNLTITDYIKACIGLITIPQPYVNSITESQICPLSEKINPNRVCFTEKEIKALEQQELEEWIADHEEEDNYYASLPIMTEKEIKALEQQELEEWIAQNG